MTRSRTAHALSAVPRYRQLRSRLALAFVLFALGPGLVIGAISYVRSAAIIESQAARLFTALLTSTRKDILGQFQRVEAISEQIASVPGLRDILLRARAGYDDLEAELDDFFALSRLLRTYETPPEIHRVRLMIKGDAVYIAERNNLFAFDDSMLDRPADARTWWTGVRDFTYLFQDTRRVLTHSRMITSWYDLQDEIGILSIDVPEAAFVDALPSTEEQPETVVLFRESNYITPDAGFDAQAVLPVLDSLPTGEPGLDELVDITIGNVPHLAMAVELGYHDWKLVAYVRSADLYAETVSLRRFVSFLLIAFLALAIVAAATMARALSDRLHELSVGMNEVVEGNYRATLAVRGNDEIAVLQRNFNAMTQRIHKLIQEVYETTIQWQAAELRALEAHITPHFLYNTLDAIKWQAKRVHATGIAEMSSSLSRYFRISLSKGREMITLAEEFELVESYLEIQNIRFDNSIAYVAELDPGIEGLEVLKFVLQPLVENSISHGFAPRGRIGGSIRVGALRDGNDLLLSVSDDGVGIAPERVATIASDKSNGYGLWNVSQRIRLYYGEGYGLSIASTVGAGTDVTVRLAACPKTRLGQNVRRDS